MSEKKYDYEEFSKQDLINWIELCHELLDSHGITYDNHGALYSVYGRLNLYEEKTNAELAALRALLREAGEAVAEYEKTMNDIYVYGYDPEIHGMGMNIPELRKKIEEAMA